MTRLSWLLLLIIGVVVQVPAARSAYAEALSFRWPTPASATVLHEGLYSGQAVKTTYRITAEKAGNLLRVRVSDFQFIEVGGQPLRSNEDRAALLPMAALGSVLPSFEVSADGEFQNVVNADRILTALAAFYQGNPAAEQQFAALQASPRIAEVFAARAADAWNTWVGMWIGREIGGEPAPMDVEVSLGATTLTLPLLIRNLGPADNCPGCIRLQAEGEMGGPELRESYVAASRGGQSRDPGRASALLDSIENVRRTMSIEVVTHPDTLLPVVVSSDSKLGAVRAQGT
jgi:hypothetical protein